MTYVFLAYSIIWLGVLAYVFMLAGQTRQLRRTLDALEGAPAREERVGRAN